MTSFLSEPLHCWVIPCAFLLDLLFGDPPHWPHPVRWMGRLIASAEPWFRRLAANELLAGALFAASLILGLWLFAWFVVSAAWRLHGLIGCMVESILLFFCLSSRSLAEAAQEIKTLLDKEEVNAARAAVAMIVGRDVERYQANDIARATVETVAENVVDGVISPLFFAVLGGAPLALAYKMVNTLDSMVGYKNERYALFGRTAARIDDFANMPPARIAVGLIAAAALLLPGASASSALRTGWKEGSKHASPNAGYPEAAFAGALRLRLNGPNFYGGQLVDKPWLGAAFPAVRQQDISRATRLMLLSSALAAALAMLGVWALFGG